MTATAALELDRVTVRHADGSHADGTPRLHTALDDATLQVMSGSFTAIVGPSGSGKSTLLSAAAGLLVPDSGSVRIAGKSLDGLGDDERTTVRREHVGMVFQQANLLASLDVVEQLLLPLHLSGVRGAALRSQSAQALELLDLVGMSQQAGRRPHQLSGGQRQRVSIARALMTRPQLILVDEPTSALDEQASSQAMDLLLEVTRSLGPATVMVTHDLDLSQRADRVITVHDGRLS